jgi:hypothetical protein
VQQNTEHYIIIQTHYAYSTLLHNITYQNVRKWPRFLYEVLKIIITSRNRVSTPGDFPRRILPIDDRHGVISGTWLHSADVATTSHFLRDEGKKELQCGPHVTVVQERCSLKYSYNICLCTIYVILGDTESRSDYAGRINTFIGL